jgi:hypothetical protein
LHLSSIVWRIAAVGILAACATSQATSKKPAKSTIQSVGCLDTLRAADSVWSVAKLSVTPQDTAQRLPRDFEAFFAQEFRRRFHAPTRMPLSVVMGVPPCDSIGSRCVGGYLEVAATAYAIAHFDGKLSDIQVVDPTLTPAVADTVRSVLASMSKEGLSPATSADSIAIVIRLETDANPDTVPALRQVFRAKVPRYDYPFRYASMPESGAEPRYPFAARLAGVGDSVVMAFTLDTEGRIVPESLELVRATYRDFIASVLTTLERTRYHPARLGDCPVSTRTSQRFVFKAPD